MSTSSLTLTAQVRRSTALPAELTTGATFVIADTLAVVLAFAITIVLRGALAGGSLWPQYFRLMPFLLVIPVLIALMDLYPGVLLNPVEEFRRLTVAISVGMSLMVVVTFLLRESAAYSRAIFLAAIPLGVALAVGARWFVRQLHPAMSWWGIPTILIGPAQELESMRHMVEAQPSIGIRIALLLDADQSFVPLRDEDAVSQLGIPYALVVVPPGADSAWVRRIERTLWGCKKIIIIPSSVGRLWSWMRVRDCCGVVGLEVQRELLRRRSRILKRTLDWVLALTGTLLVAPTAILIALLIKLTSRGPMFYGQRRIGENGRTFRAWKFRTMVVGADDLLENYLRSNPHLRREWEADHKLRNDPRVTRIGRFLRKTSIDELPQIWNVIRGEMSLVGPRPIVFAEIEKYDEGFELYRRVRPGITGLWQVSGRNDTTYPQRVAMDVYYVRNWSVWLDIYLLAKTVGVVLRKQGAY